MIGNQKNTIIGFEFEFFSNLSLELTLFNLEKALGKRIHYFDEGHSDFKPSESEWKLERDYSGGRKMYELVSYNTSYESAMDTLNKVFSFINRFGYTTDKCAFQVNISITDKLSMMNFNKMKFILNFDEEYIYKNFPNRKNNLYCKSIKQILPISKYYMENTNAIDPNNYVLPDSKYYGVNFLKLKSGYLEFRYLGGKDYEKKIDVVKEYIDYFIETIKQSINGIFNNNDIKKLKSVINKKRNLLSSYNSYKDFIIAFPDVQILVDLIRTPSHVEVYYRQISDKIFHIMNDGNLERGVINYNTSYSSFEIKDFIINSGFNIEDVDLISGLVTANLFNCNLFECQIDNSNIQGCRMYQACTIEDSKLNNCYVSSGSKIDNCYIAGGESVVLGELKDTIFRSGKVSSEAYKDAINTEFISVKRFDDESLLSNTDKKDGNDKKDNK